MRRGSPWSSRIFRSSAATISSTRVDGGEDLLELGDEDAQLLELVDDLLALEAGEALELHLQDGLGLEDGEAELRDEAGLGLGRGLGRADEGDHLVEMIEGDDQAFEDVGPRLGLAQLVEGPPPHHLAPEVDEELGRLEQVQDPGALVHDGQEDDAEGVLELGVLVEVVQDDLGRLALLDVEDDAHAVAVALVADVGEALDALLLHELGDLLDEPGLVDLVGDLRDHDRLAVALLDLDLGPGAHDHGAAAGAIGLPDARPGPGSGPRSESRARGRARAGLRGARRG